MSYLLEEEGTYETSRDQLNRIISGEETGLISYLVLCEIIDVAKKKLLERETFQGTNPDHLNSIKESIRQEIQEIIARIITLTRERKIMIIGSQKTLGQSYAEIFPLIQIIDGEIRRNNYCPKCHSQINPPIYKFRTVGHYDIQHALLAKEVSASDFVTYDKAFPQLHQLTEFESLPITLLEAH